MTRRWFVLVAWLWFAPAWSFSAEVQRDHCVILLSIDGLAGFYLDDPRADMPTLRRLIKEGARADGLVCSFPTVTWPNHTTLVTGVPPSRHGVIGNNFVDRETGKPVALILDPVFDQDQIIKTPTIHDVAHRAGLTTSAICWPSTRNAKSLDWTVPDMFSDGWDRYGTPAWLDELRQAGLPVDMQGPWAKSPGGGVQRDWLYTRMAEQVLRVHQPNVLLVHLVEVDHVQHKNGPRTPDAYWSVSYADDRLRDLVEAIERSPRKAKTTLFVCSDHGFFPIDKEIRPNVLLRQLGLLQVEGKNGADRKGAFCLSQGGACAVYVFDKDRRAEIVGQLASQLKALPGVAEVILPADYARIGQPTPDQDPRGADLWLSAKMGYSFADTAAGDQPVVPRETPGGTHGYLPSEQDLFGTCVVWGAGVKPGAKLGRVNNVDIAPTMAHLLGLELPEATGKRLPAIERE